MNNFAILSCILVLCAQANLSLSSKVDYTFFDNTSPNPLHYYRFQSIDLRFLPRDDEQCTYSSGLNPDFKQRLKRNCFARSFQSPPIHTAPKSERFLLFADGIASFEIYLTRMYGKNNTSCLRHHNGNIARDCLIEEQQIFTDCINNEIKK